MTQEQMLRLVPETLRKIEKEHGVKVLYAAESGSRAWGFASPDSDFDVRFVYCRTEDSYLLLEQPRDVIELPIDDTWDVSGWDLQKALRLLAKSNPSLYEWFRSPICYWDTGFSERIRPLFERYYSTRRLFFHYYSMAGNNARANSGSETVKPKSYFYVLRPLLACRWILELGTLPPIPFAELAEAVLPEPLRPEVDRLLELKISGAEGIRIPHDPEIDSFVETELAALSDTFRTWPEDAFPGWEELDRFFREEIR